MVVVLILTLKFNTRAVIIDNRYTDNDVSLTREIDPIVRLTCGLGVDTDPIERSTRYITI